MLFLNSFFHNRLNNYKKLPNINMFQILGVFNLFRTPFFLRIKRLSRISTNFGLLLSLFVYLQIIFLFSKCDIFHRESPRIINNTKIVNKRPIIHSDSKFLSASVIDMNGKAYNDPSFFSIRLSTIRFETIPNYKIYNLTEENIKTTHLCNENDTLKPEDFYRLDLKDFYCIDNGNFTVEGSFLEPVVRVFSVGLSFCKNTTENNNSCKSIREIKSFLENKYFSMIYVDNAIQVNDYENPIQKKYNILSQRISTKLSKTVNVLLQKASISTNDGVIFSNIKSEYVFQAENQEYDFKILEEDEENNYENFLVAFLFYSSSKIIEIERSYQSLSEAVAIIGGIYSFLFFIGRILVYLDHMLFVERTILNQLYVFPRDGDGNTFKTNHSHHFAKQMDAIDPSIKLDQTKKEAFQNENWSLFQKITGKKTQFDVNVYQYLKLKIKKLFKCQLNNQEKLYLKAENIFHQEIDIIQLLKRTQEIEKIKHLFLNRKQILLFKFLEKPMVRLDRENNRSNSSYFKEDISEKELKEAYEYYYQLANSNHCSTLEKRIIALVDKRLKNLAGLPMKA